MRWSWALFGSLTLAVSGGTVRGGSEAVSFTRDVVPALTKLGCNSGSCHGSFQSPAGGFQLSLWGFDPLADYDALVKHTRGRRVLAGAPDSSLVLLKPTGQMPHAGGTRMRADSEAYRTLRQWIASGASPAPANDPVLTRLVILPEQVTLSPEGKVSLKVQGVWSDGSTREVTPLAVYKSDEEMLAEVNGTGEITARRHGQTAVTVRYQEQVAAVTVTVPFAEVAQPPAFPEQNFIDREMVQQWQRLNLTPAPLSTDAEFLRRVSLDLIGTLPTPEEVRAFVSSTAPDKRARVIDALLERPEYVDYWSLYWADLLRAHPRSLGEKGLASFQNWLHTALRENRPIDQMTRELLTASGNLYTKGPVAYFFVDTNPLDLSETTAQVFLGVRLQCARCHHHPFEIWSQDDFHGLAAFFARVERKDTKEGGQFGGLQAIRVNQTGKIQHPKTGANLLPRIPGTLTTLEETISDPRRDLATWLTAAENPYFARNVVNRYWGQLLGRGLFHPVDDQRNTNPSVNPALLEALSADFVAHQYDLKHLLRTIANSRTYQLAAELTPERDAEGKFFAHRTPRRLNAEVLLDAINQATGTKTSFKDLPPGLRSIALPSPREERPPTPETAFLQTFGRSERTTTCACARQNKPDLRQALLLANGDLIHQKVSDSAGRINALLLSGQPLAGQIEELYLATLCRRPDEQEQATAARLVGTAPTIKEGLEDLLWVLLNTAEFSFNH